MVEENKKKICTYIKIKPEISSFDRFAEADVKWSVPSSMVGFVTTHCLNKTLAWLDQGLF